MQIVITIDDKDYNDIITDSPRNLNHYERLIVNGTLLPKGHRFVDADEILNHAFIRDDEEGDIFVQKYYCIKKEIMDNALVLFDTLETDKGE